MSGICNFDSEGALISNSNHMFGWAIWDELPECNFEILKFCNFKTSKNHEGDLFQKLPEPNVTTG